MTEENNIQEKSKAFNKEDKVPEDGEYICVPCGYRKRLKVGEIFGECTSCLAGTEEGNPEYIAGTGLWEKISKE